MLSLGTIYRVAIFDADSKTITIATRYLWFIVQRRKIPFCLVHAVTYGYDDMSADSFLSIAHDSNDWFAVGLRFTDDTELHLFYFIGDGTFTSSGPWPDWFSWDGHALVVSGGQEKESRAFVNVLSKIIGVTVMPPSNC